MVQAACQNTISQSCILGTQIPVVSVEVPVDPGCRYEGLPTFNHFGDSIAFVGGINKPKRVLCYDRCGRAVTSSCQSF